jgi:hypothetical protein
MQQQPSQRITSWLRDFDPLMRIRWSRTLNEFAVERKARVDEKVRAEVHRRAEMAYNAHETDSPQAVSLATIRRHAKADLEAMAEGYRLVVSATAPLDEPELIEWLKANDPWRHGNPEEKGADAVATKLADEQRNAHESERQKTEADISDENRHRAADGWLRLQQLNGAAKFGRDFVAKSKRKGKPQKTAA